MTDKEVVASKFRKALGTKEDKQLYMFATTGDGSSAATADVANRPYWAWVRYSEKQDRASQVLNLRFPGIAQEVPVIIGKQFPHEAYYQILDLNTDLYRWHWSNDNAVSYVLPAHGATHTAGTGSDPAWINLGNILPGIVRETAPVGMSVYVEYFTYSYNGALATWTGGSVDLTGFPPGETNYHLYTLVSFDVVEQQLRTTVGVSSPITIAPTVPNVPNWNIPKAVVKLEQGMSSITDEDIYDYRILWTPVGTKNIERNFNQYMHYMEMLWTKHLTGEI